ncbi:MAG TPA: hypothetical protein VKW09_11660 [bacterium]|nr:hypothetical protein [bacterium]
MAVEPEIDNVLISKPHLHSVEHAVEHTVEHTPHGSVAIVPLSRVIEMYSLSEQELEQIGRASSSLGIHLVFFGIAFGASLAFLISLLAQELTTKAFALVWALFVLSLAAVYFGIQATRFYRDARHGVRVIKEQSARTSAS